LASVGLLKDGCFSNKNSQEPGGDHRGQSKHRKRKNDEETAGNKKRKLGREGTHKCKGAKKRPFQNKSSRTKMADTKSQHSGGRKTMCEQFLNHSKNGRSGKKQRSQPSERRFKKKKGGKKKEWGEERKWYRSQGTISGRGNLDTRSRCGVVWKKKITIHWKTARENKTRQRR